MLALLADSAHHVLLAGTACMAANCSRSRWPCLLTVFTMPCSLAQLAWAACRSCLLIPLQLALLADSAHQILPAGAACLGCLLFMLGDPAHVGLLTVFTMPCTLVLLALLLTDPARLRSLLTASTKSCLLVNSLLVLLADPAGWSCLLVQLAYAACSSLLAGPACWSTFLRQVLLACPACLSSLLALLASLACRSCWLVLLVGTKQMHHEEDASQLHVI